MRNVPLKLISEPAPGTKAVIDRRSEATIVFSGKESNTTYVCGSCASALIVGLRLEKFEGVVVKCNHCKSFNAVESSGALAADASDADPVKL